MEVRLAPGRYHYKYIVDGAWAVNPHAPQELDRLGNLNNLLSVPPPPPRPAGREDRTRSTRLAALMAAFDNKLGLGEAASYAAS